MDPYRGSGPPEEGRALVAPLPPVLVFRVGDVHLATDVSVVREVIALCEITRLPFMPEFFEGVVRLRGTVIPVLDLRKRFEVEPRPDTKRNRIVLVGMEGRIFGVLVDEVFHVLDLEGTPLLPPPRLAEGLSPKFLKGVFEHPSNVVFLLDLRELFTSAEKAALRDFTGSGHVERVPERAAPEGSAAS